MISFGTPPSPPSTSCIFPALRLSALDASLSPRRSPSLTFTLTYCNSFFLWFVVFVLISAQLSVRRSVSIFLASDPIRQALQ